MPKKIIIEVRVNEYTMRDGNPHVPWTPQEIGGDADRCREAGAASIHFHARKPDGAADLSYETYREIMHRIRSGSDLLIQPTLGVFVQSTDPAARLDNIVRLRSDGFRPDFAPLDMGSTNADLLNESGSAFLTEDTVYQNSTGTLRYFAESLRGLGVKPYLHIWNVPQVRLAEIFHRLGILDGPVWMGLSHSGSSPIYHPATLAGLDAYLGTLPGSMPVEWSANAYGASLLTMAPRVIAAGGHLSIGIGDHHYAELGAPTNADLVRTVVDMAKSMGREPATPDEAADLLGVTRANTANPNSQMPPVLSTIAPTRSTP